MKLTDLQTFDEQFNLLKATAERFAKRARYYDENGLFPFENIEDLRAINYPLLTVPRRYGGLEITLVQMLQMQEMIASYDGSTALSIGWHLGITKDLDERQVWEKSVYASYCQDVVETGALINNAATEPGTGSPIRGGRPETVAIETEAGWVINGRKSFTTLSPVLDYFIVKASIEGTDKVGDFLLRHGLAGLSVDETWDSVAMKATGSHDLVLEDVVLKKEGLVHVASKKRAVQGWLLHIPAVYLGIASASQQYATQFATTYSPNSITGTISAIPSVRQRIGEIELLMFESRTLLYAIANKWDESNEQARQLMGTEISSVKLLVVNNALKIVDSAMRIVGARSLSASCPLQRYYRDVRAGLHNPPMDDMTIMSLATQAIDKYKG